MLKPKTYLCIIIIILLCLPVTVSALHFARWHTTMGNFTATLRDEIVPITANNFIDLTNDGFYNGLHFHRVVEGFVIQDGCPLGTGFGGPGYTIQDEISPLLHHDSAGVLAMARTSAPNSAGSQYYITLAPTPHLDGGYAIFGKVFEGLDVVMAIGSVPVYTNDHPVSNVYIDSLRILDLAIFNVSPPSDSIVSYDVDFPLAGFVVEAFNDDLSVRISWYIDDILQPLATDIMFSPAFPTLGMHTVKCVTTTDEISWTTQWQVNVWSESGTDDNAVIHYPELQIIGLYPNPFRTGTKLDFRLEKSTRVEVHIYNVKGRLVDHKSLQGKSGLNSWYWNGQDKNGQTLTSGIYFFKAKTASGHSIQKAVLLK